MLPGHALDSAGAELRLASLTTTILFAFLKNVGRCVQPVVAFSNTLRAIVTEAGLISIGTSIFTATKETIMNASYIFTTCGSLGLVLVECLGG